MESKRVTEPGANAVPQFQAKHDTWSATGVPRSKVRQKNRTRTKMAKATRRKQR